jgi:hypothetical protein
MPYSISEKENGIRRLDDMIKELGLNVKKVKL